jgi:UDP-3-O-[3-hydroxymyristoyl] glucosamine N-acyltransferase
VLSLNAAATDGIAAYNIAMAQISEIAELVGSPPPPASYEILRVSGIPDATPTTLVFASDPEALGQALNSPAGAILTRAKLLDPATHAHRSGRSPDLADPRLLSVADPRYAFSVVAHFLAAQERKASAPQSDAPSIHPSAVVSPGAQIGQRTSIGPLCVIEDDVIVGDDCSLRASVTIYAGTTIGDRVILQAGAVLGSTGFGYARNSDTGAYLGFPQIGTLQVEDDVEIGANSTIDRGALGETRIGTGTKIDNLVHVGHNCRIGRHCILAAQTGISGSSVIEDGALLGGQVGLGEHAQVGPGVILGGGAGVLSHKKLFGAGQVFWGRPARPLRQYLRDLARLSRT